MLSRFVVVVAALTFSSRVQADCHHDNCLRAFIGSSTSALAFCATYTPEPAADPNALASSIIASISASGVTGTYTATQASCTARDVPGFLAPCSEIAQIASACSCLTSSTATTAPTSVSTLQTSTLYPTTSSSSFPIPSPTAGCGTNPNWPGWSSIKHAFVLYVLARPLDRS